MDSKSPPNHQNDKRIILLQRGFGTIFLGIMLVYHVLSFGEFRKWFNPPLRTTYARVFWPNLWRMFTHPAARHVEIEFQGLDNDEEWVTIPMSTWYPARWESGYRWDRPAARRSGQIQEQFLHLACDKSQADKTRMVALRWKKTKGRLEQPKRKLKTKVLKTWDCKRTPRAPKGRVL